MDGLECIGGPLDGLLYQPEGYQLVKDDKGYPTGEFIVGPGLGLETGLTSFHFYKIKGNAYAHDGVASTSIVTE